MSGEDEIARLQAAIEELKRRLPRHSVRPAMLIELEELEEQLARAREAHRNAQADGGS
ncbi:MAG: histidine kinase [Firmicutes bacterium]|nr:histidine kinase [Bacillota bacterium]